MRWWCDFEFWQARKPTASLPCIFRVKREYIRAVKKATCKNLFVKLILRHVASLFFSLVLKFADVVFSESRLNSLAILFAFQNTSPMFRYPMSYLEMDVSGKLRFQRINNLLTLNKCVVGYLSGSVSSVFSRKSTTCSLKSGRSLTGESHAMRSLSRTKTKP